MGNRQAIAMLATCALCAPVPAARAQAVPSVPEPVRLQVVPLRNLYFGTVLPGIPVSLPVGEASAGQFEIRGAPGASIRVELLLPGALVSPRSGELLLVSFGPGDGHAGYTRGNPLVGLFFNPHAPVIGALSVAGRLYIRLGGTVRPGLSQSGGEYSGTIHITIYDLGS